MPFGQLVIGPPGSGKTTYCNGMQQYLTLTGRKVAVINLDPANDALPYECAVDIGELVSLEAVQNELKLGPNGGLIYCMDYLESNLDWLWDKLQPLEKDGYYFLFDCPGQVELFTLHSNLKHIVEQLTGKRSYRLAAVHLVDAHLCSDPAKYISALLLSLSTMLHLELPHINVLSKMDLIEAYGQLDFNLDYYTEVQDLSKLVDHMGDDLFSRRFQKLSRGLCEVVEDFALLHFVPLAIEDTDSVKNVVALVDKSNGYVFSNMPSGDSPYPPEFLFGAGTIAGLRDAAAVSQEKYMADRDVVEQ
ncbi:hypothetical protein WJX72_002276 [[Myrmecia] bisecta]|uniref:GPN-loop GTPase 2 n=1 Tax=[Myrmecia] bisecta TaxID=41462 RepID=A0AAW1R4Z1_9CHLO